MTHNKFFFLITVLTINLLACKSETKDNGQSAPQDATKSEVPVNVEQKRDSLARNPSETTQVAAPASARPVSSINSERILMNDATQIPLPKPDDKSTITLFFATPGAKSPESTALSSEGLMQSTRLTRQMANVGLAVVWAEGNTGMQTGLGSAKENKAEFNLIEPKTAAETLKTIVHNYMGKRILIVASPQVISDLVTQLAGKKVVEVPSAYAPVLYYAKARAIGDADVMEMSY